MLRSLGRSSAGCCSPPLRRWCSCRPCIGCCGALRGRSRPRIRPEGAAGVQDDHDTGASRMDQQVREYGEDTQAAESHAVSAQFDPATGERLKRAAKIAVIVLAVAFVLVSIDRFFKARSVARETREAATARPLVDVITAKAVGAVQRLVLPGYTAAWHASTIYARVDGFVGDWYVDIGDRVHAGQVLATIETPDLDAELAAARAQL